MDKKEIQIALSDTDRTILESYKTFLEGLSDYIGPGYEIVLHSLENLNQSVIKIINGHLTGRREGAPITDLALEMLEKLKDEGHTPYISYMSKNKKGEPIKSATIAIKGDGGRIIGLMCVNFSLNTPLSAALMQYQTAEQAVGVSETFADNASEVIEKAVSEVQSQVLADKSIPQNYKKKEIILRLAGRGIFNLKDAVGSVAERLGISRNTVYLHLRNRT